jgi:predicted nucleic acid-binding OB-fold protein
MSATQDTTEKFLDLIMADSAATAITDTIMEELRQESAKAAAEMAKERLKTLAKYNQELLDKLKALDKRRKQYKDSLDATRALAKKVVEGTIDESESSFTVQALNASLPKGSRITA